MVATTGATPVEFGAALRGAREASGIALETIASRTKISLRTLTALENGEFGKLPDRVFAKMFLRQYLEVVGARADEWLPPFEAACQRIDEASHPSLAVPGLPIRKRRVGPWVIGTALVAAGVAGLLLVGEGPHDRPVFARAPVPTAVAAAPTPSPPTQPSPVETPAGPARGVLVVRTANTPCWVEVRVLGEKAASRLLAASSAWEIPAGGREVDLVLGDAGAASVEYMGEVRRPAGPSGTVARIHLDGSPAAAPTR